MNARRLAWLGSAGLAFLLAGCAAGRIWQSWEPDEQRRYFGLILTGSDSAAARYAELPERAQRDQFYQQYWSQPDSQMVPREEHLSRLERAWNDFGGPLFFRDARSQVLVNYGPPEKEERNNPFLHSVAGRARLTGGDYVKARAWAIWEYPSQGRYYDFLQEGNFFRTVAVTYSDRLHPLAYFESVPAESAGLTFNVLGSKETDLACGQARFRSVDSSRVRWEIYWQWPLDSGSCPEGQGYHAAFSLFRDGRRMMDDTIHYRVACTGSPLLRPLAYGQRNLDLPPGSYQLELTLAQDITGRRRSGRVSAELVGYRPGVREVSDLEMADLQDSTFVSADFQKGSFRRVVARLATGVDRYQPFFIFYEVYHLATDRNREHQVEVGFGIYGSDSSGAMRECLVDTRDLYYQGQGDCLRACHKVHPMGMEPGDYLLVIQIKDLLSGRASTITHPFGILEAQAGHKPPKKP